MTMIQSRLIHAGYAAKLLPHSYGVYVQVAPSGRQYRADAVMNIDCPNGSNLYASVFVIHNSSDRTAYLKNHVDPADAAGSTVVRGDRVYMISADRGETDKVKILNTIVTIAETGQAPK